MESRKQVFFSINDDGSVYVHGQGLIFDTWGAFDRYMKRNPSIIFLPRTYGRLGRISQSVQS